MPTCAGGPGPPVAGHYPNCPKPSMLPLLLLLLLSRFLPDLSPAGDGDEVGWRWCHGVAGEAQICGERWGAG